MLLKIIPLFIFLKFCTDSRASPALSNAQIASEFSASSEDDSSGFQEMSSITNSSTSSL